MPQPLPFGVAATTWLYSYSNTDVNNTFLG
jgi:hypothetical protein